MVKSTQKKIGQIRPPRVQITYDVEVGDAVKTKSLPFVVGVLADVGVGGDSTSTRLRDRSFIQIDEDNFNKVLGALRPTLKLSVLNHLSDDSQKLSVAMSFSEMEDFSPAGVAKAVPQLAHLLETRAKLNDLLAKLEGNDRLNDLLAEVVLDSDVQDKAREQQRLRSEAASANGSAKEVE